MKISFIILIAVFICCHSVFALPSKTKPVKQTPEQKMAQLQQVLNRAMQKDSSSSSAATSGLGLNKSATTDLQPLPIQAPSAGLVSASSTFQSDAQVPASASNSAATNATAINAATTDNAATDESVKPSPPKPSLYDEAFSNVVNQMLPMSTKQIEKLREVFTETQLAASTPPGIPPKPTSSSLLINLSPQATAPVIRLGAGYITSLVFVDATGQPWPIAAYSIGDPTSFNIQWDRKGNTLLIQSATFYKRTNMAIMMRDLNTPVMLTLISGQEAVDYRVDLRVPGLGPNAVFAQNGIPDAANPILLDVLNAIAPKGSKELKVRGGDCKAWLVKNKLYLRTSLNVISPGWQSIMSSIDGTHAYQLQPAPVILALQNGRDKILTLLLEGLE